MVMALAFVGPRESFLAQLSRIQSQASSQLPWEMVRFTGKESLLGMLDRLQSQAPFPFDYANYSPFGRTKRGPLRIIRRIVRYIIIGSAMFVTGYAAGYYLTMAKAVAVSTVTAIAGGIRVTQMVAQDLERIGVGSMWMRRALAVTAGRYFALLPLGGAALGLTVWFTGRHTRPLGRYIRRRIIDAGRRGLTGWGN